VILGVGFDMVEVRRMDAWVARKGLAKRFFHPEELEDMEKQNKWKAQSLAARFAAKEAFGKALGTGIAGFSLLDVRVISGAKGKPVLRLYGKAAELLEVFGGSRVFLSLSHEKTYAGAVVVIEGKEGDAEYG
jgi:holo-[acyl-carrier protein] synthase